MRSRFVVEVADRMFTWWSERTRVTSDSKRALSRASTWMLTRNTDSALGLQVTSQDHDRDAAQEARAGRYWMDIGAGEWDPQRRPSEVRVNRIVRIDPDGVRRIGAVLDERTFEAVAAEVQRHYAP